MPRIHRAVAALAGVATAVLAAVACGTGDAPAPGATALDAAPDVLDPVARGALALRNRACASCHQSSDPSDGLLSGQLTPRLGTTAYSANLTTDVETGIGGWPDAKIVRAIRLGIDVDDAPLCAQMPRFKMNDDEGYAIAAYLKTLPPVRRAIPASTCPPLKPPPPDAGAEADASKLDSG